MLWKLDVPYLGGVHREVTLIPFATGQDGGVKAPFELVVNFVLFIPFGAYLGFLAPSWQWWKIAGVIAGASVALETAQYALSVGSTDITDVILNTAGGLAGFGLLALARRRLPDRTVIVMRRVFAIGTALTADRDRGLHRLTDPIRAAAGRGAPSGRRHPGRREPLDRSARGDDHPEHDGRQHDQRDRRHDTGHARATRLPAASARQSAAAGSRIHAGTPPLSTSGR